MNAAAWNTNISGAASKSFAGNSDDGNNITKKSEYHLHQVVQEHIHLNWVEMYLMEVQIKQQM